MKSLALLIYWSNDVKMYVLMLGGNTMDIAELYQYTDLNYKEFVAHLLEKYGPATSDYYQEKSYNKFVNDEVKNPAKGKISRTSEGLIVHHINEDEYLNVSQPIFIKKFKYPFEFQKKENLVYANLVEHAWLHTLIAKETNLKFGLPGLEVYILPEITDYYIRGNKPNINWRVNVYNESYLPKEDAQKFIKFVNDTLHLGK